MGATRPRRALGDASNASNRPALQECPLSRLRAGKSTRFDRLTKDKKRAFARASAQACLDRGGSTKLSFLDGARQVALNFGVTFTRAEEKQIKQAVYRQFDILSSVASVKAAAVAADPVALLPVSEKENVPPTSIRGANRKGNCGRKRIDDFQTSDNQERCYHGASSFEVYVSAVQTAASAAAKQQIQNGISSNKAGKFMIQILADQGIKLGKTQCLKYVKESLEREGGLPPRPERTGGILVSDDIEKRISKLVRELRQRKQPVFPDLIKEWCRDYRAPGIHLGSWTSEDDVIRILRM